MGARYDDLQTKDGVPVYWYKATGEPDNAQILPDGTLAFDPVDSSPSRPATTRSASSTGA